MKSRFNVLIPALCGFLLLAAALGSHAAAKWYTIQYNKWGFSVQIPTKPTKQSTAQQPKEGLADIYLADGFAYIVKVLPVSDGLITSTAIEQAIQTDVKKSPKSAMPTRWEQDSKQGELFKGLTRTVQPGSDEALQAALKAVTNGEPAVQCYSMAPLKDESSPILYIGVIGPRERMNDVVTNARGMAAFVRKFEPVIDLPPAEPATASKPKTQPTTKPAVRPSAPELQPTGTPQPIAPPKPVAAKPRPAPVVKPVLALKKGEIELSGSVGSVSEDGLSLTLIVSRIRMPDQEPVELNPARPKVIYITRLPKWITKGSRVRVVGKNAGVGNPMDADRIEPQPEPPQSAPATPFSSQG